MTPHPYLYEKLIATRHAQILYDMQHSRGQVYAEERPTFVRYTISKFGSLLIEWGSHLQQTGRRNRAPLHSS
jgi:hypothetical protein